MRSASAVLLAAAALALGGCSRDLELPAPPASPSVTGFTPAAAFGGQLLRIHGQHFDPIATENLVDFASGSARAERFDGTDLVVRVPAEAGDGPITVASRKGRSASSRDAFDYLGLGEPAFLAVASQSPILQRPRAVFSIGADVILDSALYGGLVWAGSGTFATPAIERSASDPDLGLLYFVYVDLVDGPQLVVRDAVGTETRVGLPDVPHQILPLAGRNLVLTFRTSDAGVEVVSGWNATTLAPVFSEAAYGVGSFEGAADVRDGRAVVAGLELDFDPLAPMLFVVDFRTAPNPPIPAVEFICPNSFPDPAGPPGGPCPPELGTNSSLRVPLAAVARNGVTFAVAATADGNLVMADVVDSYPEPVYTGLVETFSPAPVESIAIGSGGFVTVATKPAAGYAFGFDFSPGSPLVGWTIDDRPRPTAVTTVPQQTVMGMTDLAFIASDSDNDVVVVNTSTGRKIGRVNFDVAPAAADYDGAAAYLPAASGLDGDLVFPSTAFPGLLRVPTGAEDLPSAVSRAAGVDVLAAAPEAGALWAGIGGVAPRVDGWLGYAGGSWTASFSVPLAAQTSNAPSLRLAARGTVAVVGYESGLSLIDGASPPASAPVAAAVPGATSTEFLALGFTPTGDVWALVDRGVDVQAQLWTEGAIASAGAPSATWTVPGTPLGAAWLEDGLWVFLLDGNSMPVATLLDGGLIAARTVAVGDRLRGITAISPNGRLLVYREAPGSLGFPVRFFRADPDAGFPEEGSLVLTDKVVGFAFDGTGERLFVLTQGPDRIVTID